MIRSLYSSATGMEAQQSNLDVISNNLANVNTTGFKRSKIEFQDLLYEQPARPAPSKGLEPNCPPAFRSDMAARSWRLQRFSRKGNCPKPASSWISPSMVTA